ncbi:contractile injection system tape measure protein [Algoriphagus sp.]|uniref:contractile injection system tape measure protein n=1 Tax=Algoriphagus sp. TaxID=1872435 RepID=UPI003F6EFC8F
MGSHLIHTQILAAEFGNKTAALAGQKSLQEIYYQHLIPVMEQVMDEYDQVGNPIRIEKLDLDLGRIPKDLPVDLMQQRLRNALEEQLRKIFVEQSYLNPDKYKDSASTQKKAEESLESDWEILVYFLQKGTLPWFASAKIGFSLAQIFHRILDQNPDRLKSWLAKNPISWVTSRRIAQLVRPKNMNQVLGKLEVDFGSESDLSSISQILLVYAKNKFITKEEIQKTLAAFLVFATYGKDGEFKSFLTEGFKLLSDKISKKEALFADFLIKLMWITFQQRPNYTKEEKQHFHRELQKIYKQRKIALKTNIGDFWDKVYALIVQITSNKKNLFTTENLFINQQNQDKSALKHLNFKEDKKTVIHNAGLVLTAAFLPRFFTNLGLVKNGKFISDPAQSTAVIVLQSMMPEQQEWEEPDLLLNKILCGINTAETIDFTAELNPEFLKETNLLLESMATQWTALKSKSGKMVSEGFFAREGILKKVHKGYQLHIQRMAFDILLDRLPWSIGIIKLPWMEETISVEW